MSLLHKKIKVFVAMSALFLLTGCMYPGDQAANNIPYLDQVESVQKAVDRYQDQSGGLLPIKTRDADVDPFIKYPIEFSKIVPAYTEKIPSNAYEGGGVYQYVLWDVEENPTVKVVDLRTAERIRELNLKKTILGYIPFKDPIGTGVYEIDFKKLGMEKPLTVSSPYSDVQLPFVVGGDGIFYLDYSIELNRILQEEKPDVVPGEDIRYLLIGSHPVLPAYSLPYSVNEKMELVFLK